MPLVKLLNKFTSQIHFSAGRNGCCCMLLALQCTTCGAWTAVCWAFLSMKEGFIQWLFHRTMLPHLDKMSPGLQLLSCELSHVFLFYLVIDFIHPFQMWAVFWATSTTCCKRWFRSYSLLWSSFFFGSTVPEGMFFSMKSFRSAKDLHCRRPWILKVSKSLVFIGLITFKEYSNGARPDSTGLESSITVTQASANESCNLESSTVIVSARQLPWDGSSS